MRRNFTIRCVYLRLTEPRLTLSQGTNLAITNNFSTSLSVWYYISFFWRRKIKKHGKVSLICDEWVKFRFFKESWRRQSFKLFIHEARYNRICILINGYWSLRFWIESSNKYPAGHESTISKLSRLVWDINFLSHRFYVPTRSLWSIQIFILFANNELILENVPYFLI